MKNFLIPILIVLFSVSIFAFDVSFYRSAQTLEMGETFTGIANDQNAIFYNPAGITRIKGFFFALPDLNVGASEGLGNAALKALSNWGQIQSLMQSTNPASLIQYLIQNYLPYLQNSNSALAGSDMLVGYGFGNFAIAGGAFAQGWGQSVLTNTLSLNASARAYAFGTAAFSMDFGQLRLGVGGTYRYGYAFPQIYDINNKPLLGVNFNPNLTYAATSGVDLGSMISYGQFSVGAVLQNVLNQPDMRIGLGYTSENLSAGIDFENVLNTNYTLLRKFHAGISYKLSFLTLYGGLSAGWFTGGVQANIGPVFINVGTYVLNYGNYAGYNYQRMYTAEIGING